MLNCQKCTKPATYHLTEVVGEEQYEEYHLCDECYREFFAEPQHPEGGQKAKIGESAEKVMHEAFADPARKVFQLAPFTDRARKVMQLANQEAQRLNHDYIGTEHILLGLVKEGSGVAANVFKDLAIDLPKIRFEIAKILLPGPDIVTMGRLPQTPRAKKVIEYAIEEARNLNHNYVGTEHVLLGLLREQEGVAAQVLMNLGLKLEDVREDVLRLLGCSASSEVRSRQTKTRLEVTARRLGLWMRDFWHPKVFVAGLSVTLAGGALGGIYGGFWGGNVGGIIGGLAFIFGLVCRNLGKQSQV